MKRDMDLCRKILLKIEDEHISEPLYDLQIIGYEPEKVAYHCEMMRDNNLISDFEDEYGDDELIGFTVGGLTWEGHDYLDKIRDNSTWEKVKKTIAEKAIPFTLEAVKTIATVYMNARIENAVKG